MEYAELCMSMRLGNTRYSGMCALARTVRTETVFPASTSPVMTPIARSLMHQEMRATATQYSRGG
jgi:hypothetical protein